MAYSQREREIKGESIARNSRRDIPRRNGVEIQRVVCRGWQRYFSAAVATEVTCTQAESKSRLLKNHFNLKYDFFRKV